MDIRDLAQICILGCIHLSQEKFWDEHVASGTALVCKLWSRTVLPSDARASFLHVKGRESQVVLLGSPQIHMARGMWSSPTSFALQVSPTFLILLTGDQQ